ncbi:3-oxoacyl-[acyl-carrier-protein] synthase I, chloroplastic [Artemisia annua]|uniref:beta-ketoacyl-[acyl-carrier-protein] synthase I n=1 Tax=Artemisia annua TaxID=35608 RepID=A0A2U1LWP3_ARTAN|nr:3-oxoacyl-[acyl-carrier-protein] synthase I, chloroplastic [Artemisia annua]
MRDNKTGGSIVFMTSIVGAERGIYPGATAYCATLVSTKSGVTRLPVDCIFPVSMGKDMVQKFLKDAAPLNRCVEAAKPLEEVSCHDVDVTSDKGSTAYYSVPASSHNLTQSELIKIDPFDDVTQEPPPIISSIITEHVPETIYTTETPPSTTPKTTTITETPPVIDFEAPSTTNQPLITNTQSSLEVVTVHPQNVRPTRKKALEDAALGCDECSKIDKERAGVLVGSSMGGFTSFSNGMEILIERGPRKISPFLMPLMATNMGSSLLAMDLGFLGPNYCISAACATSNYCFYAAANCIRDGKADLMIAGGVDAPLVPLSIASYNACRALSQRNNDPQTASRPWDKDRDGFVMGEGAGLMVMESLEHAMKRDAPILAEYLGGAITCDAYHMTSPRPDGFCVSSCVQNCLADANVSVEEINYINAHATSTVIGDLAEINGMKKVFKKTKEIKINATKSMIGHSLGAAGGLEAIATIKAIQTGWLHPTINQINLEPTVEFDTVANKKQQHEINVAISNSFGFGGNNSVIALSSFRS